MTQAALPRRVVVDDDDPQVQYSSNWWVSQNGDYGPAYYGPAYGPLSRSTLHETIGKNISEASSLSFRFQGSSPQVFGLGLPGAPYECFIDGTSIGATLELQPSTLDDTYNVLLCDGVQFVEGREYVLTLNISTLEGSSFGKLYFNYITYIPFPSTPPVSATVLFDRLDPAIVYNAPGGDLEGFGWTVGISDNPAIYTRTNGSSLAFNFNGTSVRWVGFVPQTGQSTSNATYSIDGAKPVPFELQTSKINLTDRMFFTSSTLNPGPHSLNVSHQGSSTTPPLTLSYLVVANNVSTLPVVPPVASSSSQPPAVSSTAAITNHMPNPSTPVGAIIGGVVGGVVILCLATILVWRCHRRRGIDSRETLLIDNDHISPFPPITPFDGIPSGPAMAEASDGAPKVHRASMMDPPEFNPYISFDSINDPDETQQVQNVDPRKIQPRTPPVEIVPEDSGVNSVTDGLVDPPPSYAS